MFKQSPCIVKVTVGRGDQGLSCPSKGVIRIEGLRTIERVVGELEIVMVQV